MIGLRILAFVALLLVGIPSAYAQGAVCADLEERVAELEATTGRGQPFTAAQAQELQNLRIEVGDLEDADDCRADLEERVGELEGMMARNRNLATDSATAVQQVRTNVQSDFQSAQQAPDPIQYDQPPGLLGLGNGYHHETVVEIDENALTIFDVWSQTEISFFYNHVDYYNAPSLTFGVRDDNNEPAFILRDDPESDCGKAVGQVRLGPGRVYAQGRYCEGEVSKAIEPLPDVGVRVGQGNGQFQPLPAGTYDNVTLRWSHQNWGIKTGYDAELARAGSVLFAAGGAVGFDNIQMRDSSDIRAGPTGFFSMNEVDVESDVFRIGANLQAIWNPHGGQQVPDEGLQYIGAKAYFGVQRWDTDLRDTFTTNPLGTPLDIVEVRRSATNWTDSWSLAGFSRVALAPGIAVTGEICYHDKEIVGGVRAFGQETTIGSYRQDALELKASMSFGLGGGLMPF